MTDTRHALIIANDHYDDRALKKLKAPGHDASALATVLHDPQIGDFEVDVVRNQPAHVLRRRVEHFFADRRRDDTLVLHFSCHGIKSESGELYFAASDTEPLLLEATAVPAQFVRRCMSRSRAGSTVLFLDCCYGGAFSRGSSGVRATGEVDVLDSFTAEKPAGGRGWAVITASSSMEYAVEGGDLTENADPRPSVFTGAVVRGLETGEADLDADGEVSLDDLYDYVYDQVREQNPHQTPGKTVEMQGELHLAHSTRRRICIVPEELPASWRTALNSKNHFTRLGAVAELRLRLESETLPRAEGARLALEDMARNDIRQVADAASAALREVRLQPSTVHLDFGRLPRRSPEPQQSVTLGGLPLARVCVPRTTEPWIRVSESADRLDVSVDTSTAEGRLSGEIVLKGITDDAVIRVEAEVASRDEVEQQEREPDRAEAEDQRERTEAEGQRDKTEGQRHGTEEQRGREAGTRVAPADRTRTQVTIPSPPPRPPEAPPATEPQPAVAAPSPQPEPSAQEPAPSPQQPAPCPQQPAPSRSRLAPGLATAALATAAASVITLILAVVDAVEAALERGRAGPGAELEDFVAARGMITPLVISLITAAVALALSALARHEAKARQERYTNAARGLTTTVALTAKYLAVPVLILAALLGVTYLVARNYW
ncbi:caspase family protein [Streptomyces sp. M41]|uniref:caspase, EACC1-associated type n=1 Tax=Streptomyces sp. M41 TaxID=3059412 RepID=UPI00374DED28